MFQRRWTRLTAPLTFKPLIQILFGHLASATPLPPVVGKATLDGHGNEAVLAERNTSGPIVVPTRWRSSTRTELHEKGHIENESSFGSSSDSGNSSEDESSSEHFNSALPQLVYTEHVPVGTD